MIITGEFVQKTFLPVERDICFPDLTLGRSLPEGTFSSPNLPLLNRCNRYWKPMKRFLL